MAAEAGLGHLFKIESAGTIGLHEGSPPDRRMAAHLEKRGYDVSGSSRPLSAADFEAFDLLLTMDRKNHDDTLKLDVSGALQGKVQPFVNFLRENQAERIPDPYYGGDPGFSYVIDLIEDGCAMLLDKFSADMEKPA